MKLPITKEHQEDLIPKIKVSTSPQLTPTGSNIWHQHTDNFVALDRDGVWKIKGWIDFGRASVVPYSGGFAKWSNENGDDTASVPGNIPNIVAGINFINSEAFGDPNGLSSTKIKMVDIYVNVSGGTQNVYLNSRADDNGGNFAQMRITVHIQAEYLGKISLNSTEVGE